MIPIKDRYLINLFNINLANNPTQQRFCIYSIISILLDKETLANGTNLKITPQIERIVEKRNI